MTRRWGIAICVTVMLLLAMDNRAYGQFAEPCRAPIPSRIQGGVASGEKGFVELVPSICVSERYDSNVFFRRATPGVDREDYVTSVNPTLKINHSGDYASGFVEAGGISETYVKHSGLNFLGSNGILSLNLNNTVKRILPNAALFITDVVNYTPIPPGFVNPVAGTAPGAPTNIQDVFAQGILFSRTNRITNSGTLSTSYATSASTKVDASYNHATLRFLSPTVGLFDTTTQIGTAGGTAQLSRDDQLNVRYSFTQSKFEGGSSSLSSFVFKTHFVTASWSRVLTPYLSVEAGGGGILINPGRTTYAANAAVITNFVNTRATLSYARSTFPSFAGVPTQLVGEVVSLAAVQQISPQWQLTGEANYSHGSGTSGNNALKFNSYSGSVNLVYLVARFWSTAMGYSYLRFDQDFGRTQNQFDRHVVMFSVRATWE